MSELEIRTEEGKVAYSPGSKVKGRVSWRLDEEPRTIELRLFWFTRGKGTTDVGVVTRLCYDAPGVYGEREFDLQMPMGPHSFSGKLVSLIWGIELVVQPSGQSKRLELLVAPGSKEIRISE